MTLPLSSDPLSSNRLQTVMFDPLSYIHPARFALTESFESLESFERFGNPRQHAIINRLLLDHYQLSERLPRVTPGSLDDLLLKHWRQLPKLAYLLSCQRFRVALSRGGRLLGLPAWARSFAVLPLRQSDDDMTPPGTLDTAALLEHGLTDLMSHCRDAAPALRQRIPLLFSPIGATAALPPPATASAAEKDGILLILALQHVKKFPGSTSLPRA